MTRFSSAAWAANLPLYEAIRDMPFNRELGAGTLSRQRFEHYIVQDAHYLIAFAQALSVAAAKADQPDHIVQFAGAAEGAILAERGLHTEFFRHFGLDPDVVSATAPSPACHHYAAFLLATAFRESLPVLLAATLPCFWVYREIGRHIVAHATPENPFHAWIETYGGEAFATAVDRMIETTDAVAAQAGDATVEAMHRAYRRATQLEWMFWDAAYRLEGWPV
jgi:thiaminase (transcriptional activator TenA)